MAVDDFILINAETVPGGKKVATVLGDDGYEHEKTVEEYVDGSGNPVKVSATTPLPVTDNAAEVSLASIDLKIPSKGQAVAANSTPVVLTAAEEAILSAILTIADFDTKTGSLTETAPATDTGSSGLNGRLQRIAQRLTSLIALLPTSLGAGGGLKIDGSGTPLPVSGTVTVDTSALATSAKQDTGNTSLASILAKIIAAPSTEAKQDTIITALGLLLTISDFDTKTGSLTETAPTTDTASSGLNGRLQRIAQRLTSLITALGSPFQVGGSIGNTSFASTIADAANVVEGALADAIVAAGATGSISAKLRRATQGLEDLKTLIVLAAGTNLIGKVGIDQTTPGTTNGVQVNAALPAGTNLLGKTGIDQTTDGTTNKVRATATQKPSYGSTVALAVTALQSLTSSATVGWGSVRVSNLATLATDYEIMVKLTTANTAPANDKCMYVFCVPWYTSDAGTTWFPSSQGTTTLPSGTDAGATIASPHNLRLLGVLNYTTAQMTVQDTFLLSNCFGNRMPDGFSITIINFSGATLSTGCIVDYSPINDILV